MKKIIKIGDKEYTLKASAYTQFKYRNDTGRKMLKDLQDLSNLQNANEEDMVEGVEDLTEIVLKMAYVMIEEADSTQVKSYEEFLKSIENLYDDITWINEVIELATSPLSRGI